jgi:hypothetical protein
VTTRGITVAVDARTVDAAHCASYAPAVGDAVALMAFQDTYLALDRVVGPGNVSDATAAGPQVGAGLIGGASTTGVSNAALASTAGASVNVPKYDLTYFHPENHVVLVAAGVDWTASATTANAIFFLNEVNSNTNVGFRREIPNTTSDLFRVVWGIVPPSLGGQARRIILQLIATGGTITVRDGNPSGRGFMYLMDLGDASFAVEK